MRLVFSIVVVGIAVGIAPAQAQSSGPQNTLKHGRLLVQKLCGQCHATGRSGESPHAGAPEFRRLGDLIDLDELPARLRQGLSSGHPDMPTFKFKPRDARAVLAYLRSIQN